MKLARILTSLAGLPAFLAPLQAGPASVYPTPQQVRLAEQYVRATAVECTLRTAESRGGLWDSLPADARGGYAIRISPQGAVQVCANDEDGLYYAKQTLSQLLRGVPGANGAQRDPFPALGVEEVARLGELPVGTVADWPDLPFRGAIEGYYGIPWSFSARKAQFEFYGRNKMNFYLYAPKDDPLHHGQGCYEPYPAEKAEELRRLVQIARENHVHFVWAIHPSNTVNWAVNDGRDQLDGLVRKLEHMYGLGVRDFGVSVDDSFGEISKPARQVQLCNYIVEHFIRKHPDVNQNLFMCPTGYTRLWAGAKELRELGAGLEPGTNVFWTGDGVVGDITPEGQEWVNPMLQRPTFIWWNWPCNDFKPSRLSMGRTYGLSQDPAMKKAMSGLAANPMERAEASKVGLFGVADYAWNITGFQSEQSWKDGISRLYPQSAAEMQLFCNHNADLLPNCHNWPKEESVAITPMVNRFRQSLSAGEPDSRACREMRAEFQRMAAAGHTLQTAPDTAALNRDISPWLRSFTMTGQAGMLLVDAVEGSANERLDAFLKAGDLLEEMNALSRDAWQSNKVVNIQDVQVGSRAITPALRSAYSYLNACLYSELANCNFHTLIPAFTTNKLKAVPEAGNIQDRDYGTFWSTAENVQSGDWVCLDMGVPVTIHTVTLTMGSENSHHEIPLEGQFEISVDGRTWQPLGEPQTRPSIHMDLRRKPATARMLRYRVLRPNRNRLTITEFGINRPLPVTVRQTLQDMPGLAAYDDSSGVGLARMLEAVKCVPGSYLEMRFPDPISGSGLHINLDNADLGKWGRLELELEDGTTATPFLHQLNTEFFLPADKMPKQGIRAMRLTNISDKEQDIKLTTFMLNFPELDPDTSQATLTDHDFATAFDCGKRALDTTLPVPAGKRGLRVVATADCTVDGAPASAQEGRVQSFTLPEGTRRVRLQAPQKPGTRVHEIIFF
ncbi:MAG: beta-N-acetylglucosaminidase domain-containing protein [Akkermansia sp.]|nr:beta-N-acetylglucosaminidase domain-containing protein [Akkermansia sp.]